MRNNGEDGRTSFTESILVEHAARFCYGPSRRRGHCPMFGLLGKCAVDHDAHTIVVMRVCRHVSMGRITADANRVLRRAHLEEGADYHVQSVDPHPAFDSGEQLGRVVPDAVLEHRRHLANHGRVRGEVSVQHHQVGDLPRFDAA